MTTLLLLACLTTSVYYLLAWAEISRPLWSRYPKWFPKWVNAMMSCAACSGFWYGLAAGVVAWRLGLTLDDLLGVTLERARAWYIVPAVALGAVAWTPVLWGVMFRALQHKPEGSDE